MEKGIEFARIKIFPKTKEAKCLILLLKGLKDIFKFNLPKLNLKRCIIDLIRPFRKWNLKCPECRREIRFDDMVHIFPYRYWTCDHCGVTYKKKPIGFKRKEENDQF